MPEHKIGKYITWTCFLFLSVPCLQAAEKKDERRLVAVMPFSYKAGNAEQRGLEKGLSDAFAAELVKKKKFRVIERERTDQLMQEILLQQTGLTDAQTAARVGKQLGASAYVFGSVVSVTSNDEWRSVKFAEKTVRRVEVEAEVKLVDVETGELLASGRAVGRAKTAEKHAFGGKTGELAAVQSMAQKAVQDLSVKLAKDLVKTYSGR